VRFRLNLQWKILLLVAGSMSLIVLASSYLHSGRTRSLIEKDHYENAVSQTFALGDRISEYDYFSSVEDLQQEMQLVVSSRPDFRQIDVYENQQEGPHLIATTSPGVASLLSLWNSNKTTAELFQPGASSVQINRDNGEYWLITAAITNPQHSGFIKALVLKSYHHKLVNSLHRQYNLALVGAVVASVVLLYLLFVYFFRRPVKDIVQTMGDARKGDLSARAVVRRDDELGEIARGFNQLMNDVAERSRERDDLLNEIGDLNDQLVKKVNSATGELRTANANLIRTQQRLAYAERMAAIGQVTASLAHEIGTPLNAMAGHLQLLARNHADSVDTQRRLNIINSQLASIVQTVKSLLERTHRRPIEPQLTDINAMAQDLLLLIEPMFDSRNIRVSLRLAEDLPRVLADPESLHQVFLNLVNNSLEAMPEGGEMEIVTNYLAEAGVVEVRFIDSGVGISDLAKEHLFEPMWTTKQSGSGLGLAIAREIIVEHGGEIECVTEVQNGAEFRVVLTAVEPASTASKYTEVRLDAA
jgi:two-component system, NtrC family, sensor kinase